MNQVAARSGRARRKSPSTPAAAEPDRNEARDADRLVRERDALLVALDDLEDERASGDLDDATYDRLRNDYTARIAALQRAVRSGGTKGARPARRATRSVAVVGAVVALVVVVALVLSSTLGTRAPGGTLTGNAPGTQAADPAALAEAVQQRPNDSALRRQYAQSLMATDKFAALKQFDEAARLAPSDPEARAYGGWMLYLLSRDLPGDAQATAVSGAEQRLRDAIAVAPGYPDAHFFLGLVLFRGRNDPAAAVSEFDQFLALAPNAPLAEQVRGARSAALAEIPR